MKGDRIVLDANVAFRLLCRRREDLVDLLDPAGFLAEATVHSPIFLVVELFKNKERILRASRGSEEDLVDSVHALVMRLELFQDAAIPFETLMEGYRLCRAIDRKDTVYVALALHLDALLWTNDLELKTGLRARGFDRFFEP